MPGCEEEDKHVCMLPQEPKYYDLPPTAGWYRHLLRKIRELNLACKWHYGSLLFFRSQKRLRVERERQVENSPWFVWHPYSAIKYYWDCAAFTIIYADMVYMPIQVFLDCPNPYDPFILLGDATAFLLICTKFITGIVCDDSGEVTLDLKVIAKQYLSGAFIFDLISALPLQCIEFHENCRHPTHTVWFVLKLFRLLSMRRQWVGLARQMGLSYVVTNVISVCGRSFLFFHWLTYIYYQVPTFCVHYYSETNEKAENWFQRLLVKSHDLLMMKYMENLYYVCGLCNGVGNFIPLSGTLIPEMVINSVFGILGLFFLTYTFTTLLRMAIYSRYDVFLFNGRLKELKEYMLFKALPKALQQKIKLFLNYKFYEHYFNEQAIMRTLNEQIKQDVNMHSCRKLVSNVPLFQDMPVALINTIIFGLRRVLFMPGEVVVKCDQPGESIYLISSGTVAVINSSGREVAHLRDGAYFGESALLSPGVLRSATIIALEITEMYKLSSSTFAVCLQPYPHVKRRLDEGSARRSAQRRQKH